MLDPTTGRQALINTQPIANRPCAERQAGRSLDPTHDLRREEDSEA